MTIDHPLKQLHIASGYSGEHYDSLRKLEGLVHEHIAGLHTVARNFNVPENASDHYYDTMHPTIEREIPEDEQAIIQERLNSSIGIASMFDKIRYGQSVDLRLLKVKLETLAHWIDTQPEHLQYDMGKFSQHHQAGLFITKNEVRHYTNEKPYVDIADLAGRFIKALSQAELVGFFTSQPSHSR